MSNLYRELSIDASNQISVHLAKRFQRRFFRSQPIRNKNCLWWPCLLTDRDRMNNLYRGHSIDDSYQVSVLAILLTDRDEMSNLHREHAIDASNQISVHLAKRFQRRFFRNHPIRNKNCLWWPYLLTNRDEMSNHNRGLSIDTSYQVLVHLAKQFQRRRIYFFQVFYFLTDFFH